MGASGEGDRPCVLLCISGCIAAYKSCEVLRLLQKSGCRVKVAMTEHATRFVEPVTFRALTHEQVAVGLFDDPSDPIHHISLAQEADLVLVAPATANLMAKMAHGLADDLVSTTLLATKAPIVVAPAMNTGMWTAPATQENVRVLLERGVHIIGPQCGRLACGDVGAGKLAEVGEIAQAALDILHGSTELAGQHVLVTAGGTQEAVDPVRFIGNRSSGTFGYAIARAAHSLGARVTLVSGPTALRPPAGIEVVNVVSAADMFDAVDARFDSCSIFISAAAVADYTPKRPADHKLKKDAERLDLIELEETRDILATMCSRKGERVVIGFAAETDALLDHATAKLARKGCDAIVANDVSRADSGFGSATDAVLWVTEHGSEDLGCRPKSELAYDILRRAHSLQGSVSVSM